MHEWSESYCDHCNVVFTQRGYRLTQLSGEKKLQIIFFSQNEKRFNPKSKTSKVSSLLSENINNAILQQQEKYDVPLCAGISPFPLFTGGREEPISPPQDQ
mmetsp:Transcript_3093/g.7313  ORF Transcript_3093/g.7313 Transcript_3093/m.7313 type:complete len:101 (-) Transcript_3093:829-1131(-)